MIPEKLHVHLPDATVTAFDESSHSVMEICGKVVTAINNLIAEMTLYEANVNNGLVSQDAKIEQYKNDLQNIVDQYKLTIQNQINSSKDVMHDLYIRTLDLYTKTLLQIKVMEDYVDRAVSDFGSIAIWTISDSGELIGTVFNTGILISIGMTIDGRLTVTADA